MEKRYSEIDKKITKKKKKNYSRGWFPPGVKYTIKSLQLKSCGTNKQGNLFDIFLGKSSVRKNRRKYLWLWAKIFNYDTNRT